MLVTTIVHHGHYSLLPVFDAWYFLHIKEACLVPIELADDRKNTYYGSILQSSIQLK